jgi:hypothetical protein
MLDWLHDTVLAHDKISASDLDMMVPTDDVDEVVRLMMKAREHEVPSPAPHRSE